MNSVVFICVRRKTTVVGLIGTPKCESFVGTVVQTVVDDVVSRLTSL